MLNKTIYTLQRVNDITSLTLNTQLARNNLIGFAKARFENQLVNTNR